MRFVSKIGLWVFVITIAAHTLSPVCTVSDSVWTIHTSLSILHEGNTDLDEYRPVLEEWKYWGTRIRDGHVYYYFPLGPSLAALPIVAPLDQLSKLLIGVNLRKQLQTHVADEVERFVGSVYVALTALIIYAIALRSGLSWKLSVLAAFLFAFCTPAWSTASRALWQHAPSMFLLSLTLYLLVAGRENPRAVPWSGLTMALSYIVRPTNSLSIAVLMLYLLLEHRRQFPVALLIFVLPLIPWIAVNRSVWGFVLPPYYQPGRLGMHGSFFQALAANLVSPARGVLVWSPFLLFLPLALAKSARRWRSNKLPLFVAAIVVLHLGIVSSFSHWWAGHSTGPRFMTDMMPYAIFLLFPLALEMRSGRGAGYALPRTVFVLTVAFSLITHSRGACSEGPTDWNTTAPDGSRRTVDDFPERVWDWKDAQFLR